MWAYVWKEVSESEFRAVHLTCWSWPCCPVLCDMFKLLSVLTCAESVTKSYIWNRLDFIFLEARSPPHLLSITQSCLTLCDCIITPGFPVLHHLLELAQTHVYWVGNAIQPPYPLLSPSPPAFNLSQHQLFASGGQSIGASASASIPPMNIQDWFPLGLIDLLSVQGTSRVFSNTTVQKHQFLVPSLLYGPILTSIHDYTYSPLQYQNWLHYCSGAKFMMEESSLTLLWLSSIQYREPDTPLSLMFQSHVIGFVACHLSAVTVISISSNYKTLLV